MASQGKGDSQTQQVPGFRGGCRSSPSGSSSPGEQSWVCSIWASAGRCCCIVGCETKVPSWSLTAKGCWATEQGSVRAGWRWRGQCQAQHRHRAGDLQRESSVRSHLNHPPGTTHPNVLDAPHLLLPVLTIHIWNVSISILHFLQHIPWGCGLT